MANCPSVSLFIRIVYPLLYLCVFVLFFGVFFLSIFGLLSLFEYVMYLTCESKGLNKKKLKKLPLACCTGDVR